jgi:excisionase family DNA binding protein
MVSSNKKIIRKESMGMVLNTAIGRRLLNVREAAQYLGLEVDTIYRKARLREVPCVKVGRALRFDVKALEQFIEKHAIDAID